MLKSLNISYKKLYSAVGEKMNKLRKIAEKRNMIWLNFNRTCPNCNHYIPKYKRTCPSCGKYVKSIQGKVRIAK